MMHYIDTWKKKNICNHFNHFPFRYNSSKTTTERILASQIKNSYLKTTVMVTVSDSLEALSEIRRKWELWLWLPIYAVTPQTFFASPLGPHAVVGIKDTQNIVLHYVMVMVLLWLLLCYDCSCYNYINHCSDYYMPKVSKHTARVHVRREFTKACEQNQCPKEFSYKPITWIKRHGIKGSIFF